MSLFCNACICVLTMPSAVRFGLGKGPSRLRPGTADCVMVDVCFRVSAAARDKAMLINQLTVNNAVLETPLSLRTLHNTSRAVLP